MLHLECPCGHSTPYPEDSGKYKCSRCARVLEVVWFSGPRSWDNWHQWMLARAFTPRGLRGSVKNVVTSQHSEVKASEE